MVPPCSDRISRVPPYSSPVDQPSRTGLSPTMARLSRRFRFLLFGHWPGPRSLATTSGVSVDVLSSGYLDVSVPRVRLHTLCIQVRIPPKRWVSPFGHPRIRACSRLPVAYRSVPRPSSPLNAKASTRRPFALDHPIIAIPNRTCGEVHVCGWSLMEKLPVFNPLKPPCDSDGLDMFSSSQCPSFPQDETPISTESG